MSTVTITLNDMQAAMVKRAMDIYTASAKFSDDYWPDTEGQRAQKAINTAIDAANERDVAEHVFHHTGGVENGMNHWECACGERWWQDDSTARVCPNKP